MANNRVIEVRFHEPPADLEGLFTAFVHGVVTPPEGELVRDAMQPEWGSLRFFPQAAPKVTIDGRTAISGKRFVASGPTSRTLDFSIGATRFWGIGLLPLGWASFIGCPAADMTNAVVDGETDGRFVQFAPLAESLLDAEQCEDAELAAIIDYFRRSKNRPPADAQCILDIHQALLDPALPDVKSLAAACNISPRKLERVCARHFGFPPKLLLRRQRFMRSLSAFMLDPNAKWSDSLDSGYYDQSHFVREAHEFLGMSPSDYAALDHPILKDFMRIRAQDKGSPVQTLDSPKRAIGRKSGSPRKGER